MWSDDWNYYNKQWWRFKHFIFIKVTDQAGTIEEDGVIIDQPKSSKDGGMIKVLTLILFNYNKLILMFEIIIINYGDDLNSYWSSWNYWGRWRDQRPAQI